jgi:hypothetical protein
VESNLQQLAYTYVKCWMRWLQEADGNCVRDGVWREGVHLVGSDDDQVGNGDDVLIATGERVPDLAIS